MRTGPCWRRQGLLCLVVLSVLMLAKLKYSSPNQKTPSDETNRKFEKKHKSNNEVFNNTLVQQEPSEIKNKTISKEKLNNAVNEFTYDYVIKPSDDVCAGKNMGLIVLVNSHIEYGASRLAIRHTWGSLRQLANPKWPTNITMSRSYSLVFVTALSKNKTQNQLLKLESHLFPDILQGDFIDNYSNMTLKSLLGLKYVSEHCKSLPYMVKCDDDMFLDLPLIIDMLFSNAVPPRSIIGPYNRRAVVHRSGKWKLGKDEYPWSFFPPYESGAMYVITMDITAALYNASHYIKWIFIDDVYVTGIVAKAIGANHVTEFRKRFAGYSSKKVDQCDIFENSKKKVSFTNCDPECLDNVWEKLNSGIKCPVVTENSTQILTQ